MGLGERIKAERTKNNYSQASLGRLLGVTQQAVGKWEKGSAEPDSSALSRMADLFDVSIDYLLGRATPTTKPSRIPLEVVENALEQESLSPGMSSGSGYIALKAKNNGMEPRIMDGDIVIIRLQNDVQDGEIAAVFVNGGSVTLKQIKKLENGIWLTSLNQANLPVFYSLQECQELPVRILGKAIEIRSKI